MKKVLFSLITLLTIEQSGFKVFAEEAPPHWKEKSYIEQSFYDIALKNEHGKSDGLLHKWHKPIYYQIIDRTLDESLHQNLVDKQLSHLSEITQLQIESAQVGQQASLKIIFSSENDLDKDLLNQFGIQKQSLRNELTRNSICSAHFKTDSSYSISTAVVIIPVDRARAHGKLLSCIVEELTQIMGLPNDSIKVFPSIFNDKSYNDFLTALDYVLLKLLYQPEIKSGMSKRELAPHLRKILASPDFNIVIESAEQNSQKNNLQNLLNF